MLMEPLPVADERRLGLFNKNTALCKHESGSIGCDTIRAGRNLPDKEFRYLRTVIVTAAVYWGLDSELRLR